MAAKKVFNNIVGIMDTTVENPQEFLSVQNETPLNLKNVTKCLYDLTKELLQRSNDALMKVVTEEFDEEQIWQQVELQNEELVHIVTNPSDVLTMENESSTLQSIMKNLELSDEKEHSFGTQRGCKTNETKPSFEAHQEQLEEKIRDVEDEFVEFDLTSRSPPNIIQVTMERLKDIRQRNKDTAWDDIQKKSKPVVSQIYKREYMIQKQLSNLDDQEQNERESKLQEEIHEEEHSPVNKLDAMSNFHYTPKPTRSELKIISNVPVINMEEVITVAMNSDTLITPEEIKVTYSINKEVKEEPNALKPWLLKKDKKDETSVPTTTMCMGRIAPKMNETSDEVLRSSSKLFSKLENRIKRRNKSKLNNAFKKSKNILSALRLRL